MVESSRTITPILTCSLKHTRKSMKTLEDKTMTGKTAVNLPAGNPSQPSYWFWTTPMGSSDGKPEGRRHFGADRFRLENQGNVSMSEDYAATVINRINTINAKTNSSRNFQLAAWNTVKEEQGRWFAVRRFWKRKDSKNSVNGNCSSFHDWVAKLFRGASSTGTFNIYKRDG